MRAYLEALESNRPKRGRKRTRETVQRQLDEATVEIGESTGLNKLLAAQRKIDLAAELESFDEVVDMGELQARFVTHAAAYGAAKGISRRAWRAAGVPAEVLGLAGIRY